MDSRLPNFYDKSIEERVEIITDRCSLSEEERETLQSVMYLNILDDMSENVVGTISFPLSIASNFIVNGGEVLVPMATEESSVVAAASNGAKLARELGGFSTSVSGPYMIGQISVRSVSDPFSAKARLLERADEIRSLANSQGVLVSHGGGCEDINVRIVDTPAGTMVVVHLVINVQDSMGANAVNTMAESVAPLIEEITDGDVLLKILSNYAKRRITTAHCVIPPTALESEQSSLTGEEVRDRIVDAWALAVGDPYRASTHNKGILNGMDALAVATMNDWRAIEAGAHTFAAQDGYGPLSRFEVDKDGNLSCSIEVPVQVGSVGGVTRAHPDANVAMQILGVESNDELAGIFGALGLAENIASMRALADEGIQRGHMTLHAKNIANEAGVPGELMDEIIEEMISENDVRVGRARELADELSK